MNYSGYLNLMVIIIAFAYIGLTKARHRKGERREEMNWEQVKMKVVSWLVYLLLAAAVVGAVWSEI